LELIMVSSLKLKIILTPTDMEKLNITNETLDYDTTATKKAFWDILDRAKKETGFDAANDRLYVQVFPANDGGCEMFVTKQLFRDSGDSKQAQILHRKYCKVEKSNNAELICEPGDLEALISLCIRLQKSGYHGSSKLYLNEKNKYILVLNTNRKYPSFVQDGFLESIDHYPFIGEYGKTYEADEKRLSYLNEYAELICEHDAVKIFSLTFRS